MSEEIRKIRCDACGATYSVGTKTCRSCGKTLMTEKEQEQSELLHGMPLADWRNFIGKNSYYYINVFKKHEKKSFFLSFNPAAAIFRISWVFYRKMYKLAFLLLALLVFLSCFIGAIVVVANKPEITAKKEILLSYSDYISLDGVKTPSYPEDELAAQPIRDAYYDYRNIVDSTETKAMLIGSLVAVGTVIFINLFFSDWVYREHILNRTVRRKGYVSTSGEGGTTLLPSIIFELVYDYFSSSLVFILMRLIASII